MIGYATIGTKNMSKAKAFWGELLAPLGATLIMDMGRMALYGSGDGTPMIGICEPFDGEEAACGNGNMLAIPAGSRENVDKMYAKAIELGASDEGEPGERMPTFYGAYFRDLDGNKIAFFQMG